MTGNITWSKHPLPVQSPVGLQRFSKGKSGCQVNSMPTGDLTSTEGFCQGGGEAKFTPYFWLALNKAASARLPQNPHSSMGNDIGFYGRYLTLAKWVAALALTTALHVTHSRWKSYSAAFWQGALKSNVWSEASWAGCCSRHRGIKSPVSQCSAHQHPACQPRFAHLLQANRPQKINTATHSTYLHSAYSPVPCHTFTGLERSVAEGAHMNNYAEGDCMHAAYRDDQHCTQQVCNSRTPSSFSAQTVSRTVSLDLLIQNYFLLQKTVLQVVYAWIKSRHVWNSPTQYTAVYLYKLLSWLKEERSEVRTLLWKPQWIKHL